MRKFRHARRLRGELMSEINITPFVDVLLVLLISFLITAPLLTLSLPIKLPRGKLEFRSPEYKKSLLVVMDKKYQISIGNNIYTFKSLSNSIKNKKKNWNKKLPIYIQMDEKVPYGMLVKLMIFFKNEGFPQVGLVFKKDN